MYVTSGERLTRSRVAVLDVDGVAVNKWRFGAPRAQVAQDMKDLFASGWSPDVTYIEGFVTFWWQGVAEAIALVREHFAHTRICVVGAYAALSPDHARDSAEADEVLSSLTDDVRAAESDLSVYPRSPGFAYVSLSGRSADEVVGEIRSKSAGRAVRHFAFTEHQPLSGSVDTFLAVLQGLAELQLPVRFYAFGSLRARDFSDWPELATLLARARFAQIFLADDRQEPLNERAAEERFIDESRVAAECCAAAGFRQRTDALVSGVCIGRLGEDFARRVRIMSRLAHVTGSVIPWPYQPAPSECDGVPLEEQNGKLFPFRQQNRVTYRECLHLLGLAAILNAKYRERTFDFLGESAISRMFRDSVGRRAWDPPDDVKGGTLLPMAAPRP